ncbi:hypothetical protein [Nocardioides coralli]|uniref:hypothetical protein n=1 Tax=Nocardioides coralli TaxID=2872154 RepID=UPI001CA397F8|nr:hypothetical protein [Nocardioides coralli]QZY28760.1 hypothetical protein K6T13_15070 [Nocardioides coralli]
MKRKKQLLFSGATIVAAVGLVAGAGTFAALVDVDDNNNNQLRAGTLLLSADTQTEGDNASDVPPNQCDDYQQDDYTAGFQAPPFDKFRPGAGGRRASDGTYAEAFKVVCIRNDGNIDGNLSIDIPNGTVRDYENAHLEPEQEAGDATPGTGEFGDQVLLSYIRWAPNGDGTCTFAEAAPNSTGVNKTLKDLEGDPDISLGSLNAGQASCVGLKFWWKDGPGFDPNQAMDDTAEFDIQWTLNQA